MDPIYILLFWILQIYYSTILHIKMVTRRVIFVTQCVIYVTRRVIYMTHCVTIFISALKIKKTGTSQKSFCLGDYEKNLSIFQMRISKKSLIASPAGN